MAKNRSRQLTLKSSEHKALEKQVQSLLRQRENLEKSIGIHEFDYSQLAKDNEHVRKEWNLSTQARAGLQLEVKELKASVARANGVIDIMLKYISERPS